MGEWRQPILGTEKEMQVALGSKCIGAFLSIGQYTGHEKRRTKNPKILI